MKPGGGRAPSLGIMRRRQFVCTLAGAWAQEPAVFRAGVNEVRVDCEVTDGTRAITGLCAGDFAVLDNGERREIRQVTQDLEPLDLVLLFDVSGSMKAAVERVAATGQSAFGHLKEGDEVAVLTFSSRTRTLLPFTGNLEEVRVAMERMVREEKFRGTTRLLGSIEAAWRMLAERPRSQRRRAVLVVTDNEGSPSFVSVRKLVERLWETDASVSGLLVRPRNWKRRETLRWILSPQGTAMGKAMATHMNSIADQTGGAMVKAEDPGGEFAKLMERIRRRYSIYYAMPVAGAGVRRSVRVELSEEGRKKFPGARVRARKGYVTPRQSG